MSVVFFIIGMAVILVGLAVSIALHEIGHLAPAKLFKVRVGQYMIGFGPTIWSRRFGETEYGFKLLPLGGYISMAGMYPPSPKGSRSGRAGAGFFATMVQDARAANDETLGGSEERTFYALPTWKRIIIMLGGPVMNLILAIVLFTIVFSGFGVQTATTTLASVSQCAQQSNVAGDTCAPTDPIAPAAQAGLEPGDTILSIGGTAVHEFSDVSAIIAASAGKELDVVIRRDGAEQTVQLTPLLTERPVVGSNGNVETNSDGTTKTQPAGFIGVSAQTAMVPQPLWAGPQQAFNNVGAVAGVMVQLPQKLYGTAVSLFTGAERDPDGPISPVGVGVIAGEVAASDAPIASRVAGMLSLVASLNVALFVFNLIPLLPLDGGHVAVALWDGLKRAWAKLLRRPAPKPVDATKLVPVTFVVVVFLIAMGALLVVTDVVNPISILGG